MPAERHEALVLGRSRWSESSLVLRLFTRDAGRVDAVAKGCRRSSSPLRGHFDLFAHEEVMVLPSPSGGLDILSDAWLIGEPVGLRRRPFALAAATWLAEGVLTGAPVRDPHPELFDRFAAALDRLAGLKAADVPPVAATAWAGVLADLGFAPRWDVCAVCGRRVSERTPLGLAAGGVACPVCRKTEDRRAWLSPRIAGPLRAWARAAYPEAWPLPQAAWRGVLAALGQVAEEALERRLKGARVFFSLWPPPARPAPRQTASAPERRLPA